MKSIITIILFFSCLVLQAQEKWITVIENKVNSQMLAQLDVNSIRYEDGFLHFKSKTTYNGLTKKQFILGQKALNDKHNRKVDLSKFSYTIEKVLYSVNNKRYKETSITYYDVNNNIIDEVIIDSMVAKDWYTPAKGSIIEKVINAAIENLEL